MNQEAPIKLEDKSFKSIDFNQFKIHCQIYLDWRSESTNLNKI